MRIIFIILFLHVCTCGFADIETAFDIGTGKIKMQVVKVTENGLEPLYDQAEQIAQSNESILDQEGMITKAGQARIITILKSLKTKGEEYGSTKCQAIATELFRKAPNGQDVAQNISTILDIKFRIITPDEEGMFSFLTIVQEVNVDPEKIVVVDIGSGSFQITCKKENRFLVYSASFGRFPTYELVKNNKLADLEKAISTMDPYIVQKIRDRTNTVIGIGAHPKQILKSKTTYNKNDLDSALQRHTDLDLDRSDLLLAKTIMELLSIKCIEYHASRAGNTTGIFVLQNMVQQ